MKFRSFILALLALCSGGAFAASATFIAPSDYQADAKVSASEVQALALMRNQKHVKNVSVVQVNPAALGSGVISITTPDGVTREYIGTFTRSMSPWSDSQPRFEILTWVGSEAGKPSFEGASARFFSSEAGMGGTVVTAEGRVFHFGGTSKRLLAQEYEVQPITYDKPDAGPTVPSPLPAASAASSKSKIQSMHAQAIGDTTVNVLVVWSPAAVAAAAADSFTTPASRITAANNLLIAVNTIFNQATTDGKTNVHLNIVTTGVFESPKTQLNGAGQAAADFARFDVDILKQRRAPVNADAVLVINGSTTEDFGLGYAIEIGATSAKRAFVAISWAAMKSTTSYPLPHLIGHLLGADHQDANGNPTASNAGISTHARGFYASLVGTDGLYRCYHTLDAFVRFIQLPVCGGTTGAPPITVSNVDKVVGAFSSTVPLTAACTTVAGNCPVGDNNHDNAATMYSGGQTVSGFRNIPLAENRILELVIPPTVLALYY